MDIKSQLKKTLLTAALIWSFLVASMPVQGQVIVPGNIAGGTGKYVIVGLKKKGNFSARRSSKAKRTIKQRSNTRRQVVEQSRDVARKNRDRRDIDEISPEEYKRLEAEIKRMPKEEASKVLAGAGEYYVTRDEVDKAVIYMEGAVELDDSNDDAKLALSEVYTTLGDRALVKSDEYAELAARATAQNDATTARRNAALAGTETEKAVKYYEAAIKNDPSNPSAYVGLGQYYDGAGQDEKAKTNYEKALELDPGLTDVMGPLGIIYFQENQIGKAEDLIARSLADDSNNAESQFFLGLIRYKEGKNEQAVEALKKSISIDDDSAEAHYYLGAAYNRIGEEDNAIAEFEKSVAADPRFVNAWFDLGVALFNKNQFEKAVAAFEKAIQYNTDQTDELKKIKDESYANVAEAYRQAGKIDLSIARYRIAAARVKDDPELYTTYGFALAERDLWKPAIEAFQQASNLAPKSASATTNLGWAHYKASAYYDVRNMKADRDSSLQTARTTLEKAVTQYTKGDKDVKDNLAATEMYLGVVLNDMGEYDRALTVLKDANDLSDEKWPAAVNELGVALKNRKDYSEAIKQFKKAVKIQDNYVDAIYNLGETEFLNGDEKEARKAQERLKKLEPRLAERLERVIQRGRVG